MSSNVNTSSSNLNKAFENMRLTDLESTWMDNDKGLTALHAVASSSVISRPESTKGAMNFYKTALYGADYIGRSAGAVLSQSGLAVIGAPLRIAISAPLAAAVTTLAGLAAGGFYAVKGAVKAGAWTWNHILKPAGIAIGKFFAMAAQFFKWLGGKIADGWNKLELSNVSAVVISLVMLPVMLLGAIINSITGTNKRMGQMEDFIAAQNGEALPKNPWYSKLIYVPNFDAKICHIAKEKLQPRELKIDSMTAQALESNQTEEQLSHVSDDELDMGEDLESLSEEESLADRVLDVMPGGKDPVSSRSPVGAVLHSLGTTARTVGRTIRGLFSRSPKNPAPAPQPKGTDTGAQDAVNGLIGPIVDPSVSG